MNPPFVPNRLEWIQPGTVVIPGDHFIYHPFREELPDNLDEWLQGRLPVWIVREVKHLPNGGYAMMGCFPPNYSDNKGTWSSDGGVFKSNDFLLIYRNDTKKSVNDSEYESVFI